MTNEIFSDTKVIFAVIHVFGTHTAARLIPALVFLFVLAWMDRVSVGFAKLTMLSDIKLSEAAYGFGAGVFFLSYFLFELPSNLLLEKIGARKTLACITILWGFNCAAMAFVKSETWF
jgi:MFS family permease